MEINDLIRLIRKGWLLVVLGVTLGGASGFASALIAAPEYTASTRLFISVRTQDSSTASDVSQGSAAAQQKVRSYTDVATSETVLQPVIDELQLDVSASTLARRVSATTPTNTVIINIDVEDSSAQRAADTANAVGKSFSAVVEGLETPAEGASSLVRAATIQPASVPAGPSSPNRSLSVAVGALLGTMGGLGAALLRSRLDNRIHSVRDVESVSSAPTLGRIGLDPNVRKSPLVVVANPRHPLAEAYRTLRTNLQFVDLASGGGSVTITSAMPSEGKTTTTANLAIALAETGARVVVVEADLRRPRLAALMDVEGAVGLTDLLIGRAELEDVLQPWGRGQLQVLPAGLVPPNPSELLGSEAMRALLELLTGQFDYVLLDAPPLLPVTDAAVLATLTSGALVVAAVRRSRTNQLQSALQNLQRVDARVLGVILSMTTDRGTSTYGSYGSYYSDPDTAVGDGEVTRRVGRRQRGVDTASFHRSAIASSNGRSSTGAR